MNIVYNLPAVIGISAATGIAIMILTYTYFRLTWLAAFTLGLFVGFMLINAMYPIGTLMYQRNSFIIALYLIIEIFVPLYLLIYLFFALINTRRPAPPKDTLKVDLIE